MQLAPAEATLLRSLHWTVRSTSGRALPDGAPYTGGACPWCVHEPRVPVSELAIGDRILVQARRAHRRWTAGC